jgi:hypothetical protein
MTIDPEVLELDVKIRFHAFENSEIFKLPSSPLEGCYVLASEMRGSRKISVNSIR